MKTLTNKLLLIVVLCMPTCFISAYDIKVENADGKIIYYNYNNSKTALSVTYQSLPNNSYSGVINIPKYLTYNNPTYPVTEIGSEAFSDCSGLTSVTIPNSVTSIGYRAFYECTGLSSIEIPNSVTSIGEYAFYNCSGLQKVIVSDIAAWCNISFGDGYANPLSKAHYIYSDKNTEIKDLIIPNSVTSIGGYAFYNCSGLTSVTIPNSVTSIGTYAFRDCSGLTSVEINSNAILSKSYNSSSSLNDVFGDLVQNYIIGNDVTSIGDYAFCGCTGLTSIEIPNSVTSIGTYAFAYCTGLTSVTIPNSVTSIGTYAFRDCEGLTSIEISNSVTSIGAYAFYNTHLKSVIIGSGVLSIGSGVFSYYSHYSSAYGAKPIKVIWLTNTPPSGYSNAAGMVNYVANDLYTSLSNKTVYSFLSSMFVVDGIRYVPVSPSERTCDAIDCMYDKSVTHVNIGKNISYKGVAMNVKNINPYTCYENDSIKEVNISFYGNIGNYAFQNCNNMKTVTLGENITSIGSYTFAGCSSLKDMQIGSNVKTIGTDAFSGCKSLEDIMLPKATTSIGDYTFYGCSALKTVVMEDREDDTALALGSNGSSPLFSSCPLDSVYIGRNISYGTTSGKGYSPFYGNVSLSAVGFNNKLTKIAAYEFAGCTGLTTFTFPDSIKTIDESAFSSCTGFTDFVIPNSVTSIGKKAFYSCASLKSFNVGSGVKAIGQEALTGCSSLTNLISAATEPPVCDTNALTNINKFDCTLTIPEGTLAAYQAADQWRDFFFIEEKDLTGITTIEKDGINDCEIIGVYDLNGNRIDTLQRGMNIIKTSDGKTKKVMIK